MSTFPHFVKNQVIDSTQADYIDIWSFRKKKSSVVSFMLNLFTLP